MKRPTKLDWAIYQIFRWWWNPIFRDNPHLTTKLILMLGDYMKGNFNEWPRVPTSWEESE